ncbi:hypothetical protein Cfor_08323 [Coptotermes formosanus]|uniref:Suppressor of fused homolog n=1 Tax=Coptotermes formosanus TaxID=36987 RepID=A0A6L2Q626_COPFO|nr:hypothetical protein Cfor_08323 [Coptotermes formosanus]
MAKNEISHKSKMDGEERLQCRNIPITTFPPTPLGLEALYSLCRRIYPDQVNPLQVTALVKYWLGGPDPLDYISMYSNSGDPEQNIPPHWHYISFGLSDLHGDGRVHDVSGPETPSGFGFELTFRLKREPGETAPPTWPAAVMQALAKYVFQSANTLCVGDHVSWHSALDNSESRIQHMLMTADPQLGTAHTPFGSVNFVQIVGICREELQAAQHWNGPGVLEILKRLPGAGGPWLITDMRRGESMLELDPAAQEEVERGIETEGSNLSGVSARCSWADVNVQHLTPGAELGDGEGGLLREGPATCPEPLDTPSSDEFGILESTELLRSKRLESLHLTFNLEAGSLLPLAIRGRVKHGRHFTFKSVLGDTAITLVAPTVTGTLVDSEHPYVAHGPWLQVLIPDDLAQVMSDSFEVLNNPEELILPKTFVWPDHKMAITVVEDKM